MIRKNLIKSLSVVMATMLAVMTVACGQATTDTASATAIETVEEQTIEESLVKNSVVAGTESDAGKVETVYVTADANGAVNDVIVSEWLKNATASTELADTTELKNIVNVKGNETFKENGDGTLTWDAEGSDIYYQGTTDKQLPVTMKITYTLDGKEISPEELAGKSGRVTIRFDYENNAKQTVNVKGKDIEVYTPFAMVSGMMLDSDKFTNVEISNGKVISDGGNYVVMGVALPGLKESLDISDDKWKELDEDDEIRGKLSNSFEITADTTDFELGMTITMASSDILSDFGLTDLTGSDKIENLKDDMGELNDGSNKLVDGTKTLKDGTTDLKNGTKELKDGTAELKDGTGKLYGGTTELSDGTAKLYDGTSQLANGTAKLYDGTGTLSNGAGELASGTVTLRDGIAAYTNGVNQVNDGAIALARGASTAKSGAAELKTGAGSLAEGAKRLDDSVAQLGQLLPQYKGKLQVVSGKLETSVTALYAKQALLSKTVAFLQTGEGCDEEIVGFMSQMAGRQLSQEEAVALVRGSLSVLEAAQQPTPELPSADSQQAVEGEQMAAQAAQVEAQENAVAVEAQENAVAVEAQEAVVAAEAQAEAISENVDVQAVADQAEATETVTVAQDENFEENTVDFEFETLTDDETEQDANGDADEQAAALLGGQAVQEEATITADLGCDGQTVEGQNTENQDVEIQSSESGKTAEEYEALIAELQNELAQTQAQLKATQEGLEVAQAKAQEYGQAALDAKAAAEKYGAAAQQYGTAAQQLYGAAQQYRQGVVDLKSGVGYVAQYEQMLGAAKGAYSAVNEVIDQVSPFAQSMSREALDEIFNKVDEKATALKTGTGELAAGATRLYGGIDQLNGGVVQISEGADRLAEGTRTLASKNSELNDGASKLSEGAAKLSSGTVELKDGAGQLNSGAQELLTGADKLNSGARELNDGAKKLDDGAAKLDDGATKLDDGAAKLDDGVQQLLDGVVKLDKEGIKKLYEAFDGDLTDFADRMSAIQEAGNSYISFGGANSDEDSSVKFIFKTESIKEL